VRQKLDAKTAFRLRIASPRLIVPRVLRCPHHGVATLEEVRQGPIHPFPHIIYHIDYMAQPLAPLILSLAYAAFRRR
jgi:hypothetical protein